MEQLKDKYRISAPTSSELNLLDKAAVHAYLKANHFDVIIHSAWWNSSRNSTKNLSKSYEYNVGMFANIAEHADSFGKMIYFGSGAEYGKAHYQPHMTEDYFGKHQPTEDSHRAKFTMMKIAERTANIVNLRTFAVFGKHEDWEIRFISNAICKIIYDLPITIKRNVYYDYLYIDDLVRITDWFINNNPKHNAYNVCRGKAIDLLSLANIALKIAQKRLPIIIRNEGLAPEYSGDNSRLLGEMRHFIFSDLEDDIEELYRWYLMNKNKIDGDKLLSDK